MMITQNSVSTLSGLRAERPSPSSVPLVNTIFRATDTGDCFILLLVGGVKAWFPIAAGGTLGLPKYFVSPAPGEPTALYPTISSAIAAAVADGHGPNNPTVVLVYPGLYQENVVLVPGIAVVGTQPVEPVGSGGSVDAGVNIVGQVSVSAITGGKCFLGSVLIQPAPGSVDAISFGGTQTIDLMLHNVYAITSGGSFAMVVTNSGNGSSFTLDDCSLRTTGATALNVSVQMTGVVIRNGTKIVSDHGAFGIIQAGGGSSWVVEDSTFFATTLIDGTMSIDKSTCSFDTHDLFTLSGGSLLIITRTSIATVTTNKLFAGSGTIQYSELDLPLAYNAVDVNIFQTTAGTGPGYTRVDSSGGGPFPIFPVDLNFFTLSGNAVGNLPDSRSILITRIAIKTDGIHTFTVTPAAGDTIDGAANFTIGTAATQPCIIIQSDPITRDWKIVASH